MNAQATDVKIQVSRPFRIGIVLPHLGRLNLPALQYLILHLNVLQKHVEFEFLPSDPDDELLAKLKAGQTIDWDSFRSATQTFLQRYQTYLNEQNQQEGNYRLDEGPPDHFIIISLAQLSSHWYSVGRGSLSVMFLGDWKRYMAPPSLLEFIVTLVVIQAIHAISPRRDRSRSHLGTKGCIGDFNNELVDTRYKALQAFACQYCRHTIRENGVEHIVEDLLALLTNQWLGAAGDPNAPAGIVKKLGYDLFVTKGANATAWESIRMAVQQEGAKELIKLIGAVALAALLLWLGLKR